MGTAVEFIAPYSDDSEVRRHPAECRPVVHALGQPHVLPVVRRRPLGAAHRQPVFGASPARWQHRPPDAGIGDHQGLRPRLAPEHLEHASPRWRCGRSTTPIASCRRSTPTSASASTATSATSTCEGFEAQIGQRFGERVSLSASAGYTKTELQENLPFGLDQLGQRAVPAARRAKSWSKRPEWTFALRTDFDVTENLHFGLQGKKVERTLRHRPQRRDRRPRTPWSTSTLSWASRSPGFESAGAPVQRDQPARRGILRHHQLGHRRQSAVRQRGPARSRPA